ncbi:hypothetical protein KIW84_056937 [Lathyrus oleraceus]|uniref:DNA recombination and repair protein Rad51-like C-terminal domain-containing protein n=1 Tax=Pisum sativum TaxID=3888 RepID=A0A9D4WZM3_PEA|nr:hypothetical protein KIW84_056937 [Pisum sativum]
MVYQDEFELETYIRSDAYSTCNDVRNCSNPKIKGAVVFYEQGPQSFDYAQQQQDQETEEIQHGPLPVEQFQTSGIVIIDIKKLKDAGICAVESVAYTPRKDLLQIKGISEAKVDKIIETASKMLVEVFVKGVDAETVVLMTTRASRLENQDAIDTSIVGTLNDPKEARAGVQEVYFLPFNPTNKRTSLTYTDREGKMHRASKGAPEQILNLAHNETGVECKNLKPELPCINEENTSWNDKILGFPKEIK